MINLAIASLKCEILQCTVTWARSEMYGYCDCEEDILEKYAKLKELQGTTACLDAAQRASIILNP